jgi:hypothetical protein
VAPPQLPQLPAPQLRPSPNPLPHSIPQTEHTLNYDPDRQVATMAFGSTPNRTTYTVSDLNPAEAVLESHAESCVSHAAGTVKVHAHAVTESDAGAFHHRVDVEITVDGKRHFNKSWALSVPRACN